MKTHFIKFIPNISWETILSIHKNQIRNKCKPLPYNEIADILISNDEFNSLCKNIPIKLSIISPYAKFSVVNDIGVWNCISISPKDQNRKLIIYTSGRNYPLYIAAVQSSNDA